MVNEDGKDDGKALREKIVEAVKANPRVDVAKVNAVTEVLGRICVVRPSEPKAVSHPFGRAPARLHAARKPR